MDCSNQEIVATNEVESNFCLRLIERVNTHNSSKICNSGHVVKCAVKGSCYEHCKSSEQKLLPVVSEATMKRLQLKCSLAQIQKASSVGTDTKFHDYKACCKCQELEGAIAERKFILEKKNFLEEKLMSNKVQEHIINNNAITLIGNIASTLPKPTTDPKEIWSTFLKPIKRTNNT